MNLFRKIVSVFTGKKAVDDAKSVNRKQKNSRTDQNRSSQRRNENSAGGKERNPRQMRNNGASQNNVSDKSARNPGKSDRPRKSRPNSGRPGSDRPIDLHQDVGNRSASREKRHIQKAAMPPGRNRRPGGAVSEEQVQINLQAHLAWDSASYVVPPQEGKRTFLDLGLPGEILHALSDLGFQYCTPIQAQSLELALNGKNIAGKAQTGTGKTAAFLIAILTRYLRTPDKRNSAPGTPRTLVLAPTRELVIQICKDAYSVGKYCGAIRSLAVYGGMDSDLQREELNQPVDLLVATPGRLLDFIRQRVIDLRHVDTLVIDEADRMLDMGFIPDVRAIVNRLPDKTQRCTMLYSATLDETVMRLASMWMETPVKVEIEPDTVATATIRQVVYITRSDDKFKILYNHLSHYADARTIIFCNRKTTTEHVARSLIRLGIKCEMLSGDVNQNRRLRVLEDFRAGKIRTVVATDVAGRGIHVDDIAFVVNFDFPYEPEDYVHRIGRTGRAGHTGTAISFADEDESFIIPDIEEYIKEPLKCEQPEEWLLVDLPDYKRNSGRQAKTESVKSEAVGEKVTVDSEQESGNVVIAEVAKPVEMAEESAVKTEEKGADVQKNVKSVETVAPEVDKISQKSKPLEAPAASTESSPKAEIHTEKKNPQHRQPVRRQRDPKFKPKTAKEDKPVISKKPPRKETPIAKRFNSKKQDGNPYHRQDRGPRDGSESHHARPIAMRPVFATQSSKTDDTWSPGQ